MNGHQVVVMGVSGSGKTTIGELLAVRLGVPFVDADSLHPQANVIKMAAGHALDDDDRRPWLQHVGDELERAGEGGLVVACSSLKRSYREAILGRAPNTRFVYLEGSRELLAERMGHRKGHFMPTSLLGSQLATLEPLQKNEPGVTVSIALTPDAMVNRIVAALA